MIKNSPLILKEYPFNPFSLTQCVHAEYMINEYLVTSSISSSTLSSKKDKNNQYHNHNDFKALSYIPNYKDLSKDNLILKYHQYHLYINMIIPNTFIYNINYFISKYHNNTINKNEWTYIINETIKQFTTWK